MSFLSAAFLFALPLAAAPLLLHLFDRRRNVEIQWGAMQFLMDAAARKTSARRFKQWLLLLLRTFAIAALIFALARPLVPDGWIGRQQRSELILVVDNSMSMTRSSSNETVMQQAIDRGIAELSALDAGNRVRLLTAAPYPLWSQTESMRTDARSRNWIASQIQQLKPTLGRSDLLAALFTAVQAEREPTATRRRVLVLTDGQGADWRLDDAAGWARFREVLTKSTVPTTLEFVHIENATASKGNLAIDRVLTDRMLVGVDQPLTLTAQIRNHSSVGSPARPFTWQVDAVDRYEDVVDGIEGYKATEVDWTHSFSTAGAYQVTCRLTHDDDLAADNLSSLVVEVVDRVPILIVEAAPDLAEMQQDSFFVQAALGWVNGEPLDEKAVYAPLSVTPEQLAAQDLNRYRAVVIPNLTQLERDAADALRDFVTSGGGLWVGLGSRTDIDVFNQQWFAGGSGLSPVALDRIVEDESPVEERPNQDDLPEGMPSSSETAQSERMLERPRTTINPFGQTHLATTQLADNQQLDIADVIVQRRFRFVTPEQENATSVLLGLSNGQPLVVEKQFGRGRVLVQAIPLKLQWSSLARSQAFVVMVRDWIDYLSQPKSTKFNLEPGEPIALRLSKSDARTGVLTTPQGDSIELTADGFNDDVVFRTSRTSLPGDYTLEIGIAGEKIPFHVNRDSAESELSPLQSNDRQRLAELAGLRPTFDGIATAGSNQTDPLWPYLLIGLIFLMTGELLLASRLARERFGQSGVSESSEPLPRDFGMRTSMPPLLTASLHTQRSDNRNQAAQSEHRDKTDPITSRKPVAK